MSGAVVYLGAVQCERRRRAKTPGGAAVRLRIGAAFTAALVSACRATAPSAPQEGAGAANPASPSAPVPSASPAAASGVAAPPAAGSAELAARPEDARLPFDYPSVATSARAGDRVLAPPQRWVKHAVTAGLDNQTFVYFAARMVAPGPAASVLEVPGGALEALPNALIVPLPRGERATEGDLVLTAWASGTGMQRAIVVAGGSPEAPRVAYLDLEYEHPSGAGKRAETLPADGFRKLTEAGDVGTSVLCEDRGKQLHFVVVHREAQRWLGLGFGGRLRPLEKAQCRALPLVSKVEAGTVRVPVLGVFTPARVRHYEADVGRVFVRYAVGEKDHDSAVGIVNVVVE